MAIAGLHRRGGVSSAEEEALQVVLTKAEAESREYGRRHLRRTMQLQGLSLLAFACMLAVEYIASQRAEDAVWSLELTLLGKDVIFYDAELTASARLYVLTGDIAWRDHYNTQTVPLDLALGSIMKRSPLIAQEFRRLTLEANDVLLGLETEAMSVGNLSHSRALLFSEDYNAAKRQLLRGTDVLERNIQEVWYQIVQTEAWWSVLSVMLVAASCLLRTAAVFGVRFLDRRLRKLQNVLGDAANRLRFFAKPELLEAARAAKASREQAPVLRRLAWASLGNDLMGIAAFGIPSVLTLLFLLSARESEYLQQITTRVRNVQYFDLELTMSPRLAALTGDELWAQRYDSLLGPFDEELAALKTLKPQLVDDLVAKTAAANTELVALESAALAAFRTNVSLARSIVFGEEYLRWKAQLQSALLEVRGKVNVIQDENHAKVEQHAVVARILMIFCSVAVVGTNSLRGILGHWQRLVLGEMEMDAEV